MNAIYEEDFLVRQTMRERMRAKLREVKTELTRGRHLPIKVQGEWLGAVVRGFFAYHAVPTNIRALQSFRTQIDRHWHRALARRSQRGRPNWERMRVLTCRWLPSPKILHPWPGDRFDPVPEAGAECVSSARSDLCGGRPESASMATKGCPYRDQKDAELVHEVGLAFGTARFFVVRAWGGGATQELSADVSPR